MSRSPINTKINYAQAAAQPKSNQHQTHHQNQQQQQQQQKIQQAAGSSPSNNSTSSVNGKSSQKPQPLTNSTLSNGNVGRSATENKVAQQKNPVTLPAKGRQWETNTSIQFGSINQPSVNTPLSSSPVQPSLISGGSLPPPLPKNGTPTFGTVTARGSSEELVQPTPTQPTVAPTGPGSITGAPKPLAARIQNEIPRTQSAPPLLNLQDSTNAKNVGQPPGHQMNSVTPRTQQQLSTATPLQPVSTSNPPHNRKDSVSSTVSSNDGQQPQPFHPHQPQPHHNNYNQQHSHSQYHTRHIHQHHKGPPQGVPNHFQKNRDRSVPGTIPPSSHSNPQTIPNQAQTPIPLTGPQAAMSVPMWQQFGRSYDPYYTGYYPPTMYMPVLQRPPMQVTHHMQPAVSSYTPPGPKNHAVQIINPADRSVVVPLIPNNPHVTQIAKKEEVPPTPTVFDAKRIDDSTKEKEQTSDNDKKESKAVRIVDPIERDKIEREKREKEREENERKEREEKERLEREKREREEKERLEREEKERKEREEKERKEREEKERIEREERERKEREERERKEREERERKEREERERKEREENERKEREEKERKEREEKEREEREEKERKEREEKERREREEKERKEREEKERKEREEKERKEREEKERKEREEKERIEKEKFEREEKERREREEAEQREKERNAQEERERIEKEEEMERQISEKKKREAEEEEKKKEDELSDKKDSKKEEKKYGKGHKPEALDLSRTNSAPALGPGPLSSARIIDDLSSVQYPAHIDSPNPELNTNSEPGKFKYDRKFLMQFMGVCKERPDNLPVLDAVGMEEPKDDKRGGAKNSRPGGQRATQHTKGSPGQMQYSQMGEFRHAKNSDERFMTSSNYSSRTTGFGKPTLGPRTASGSSILQPSIMNPPSPGRTPSNPRRNDKHKKNGHQTQHGQNMGQDPVQPLEFTENRWVPHNKALEDRMHLETVQRKVKALLNKLTLEKFDSISDQIIEFANKSRDQRDGGLLKEVISLTFDKSCDEPNFSQIYAQLCRKMMERIDPEIVDENMKNQDKYVQGSALFRKYLLNRCQENFEKGWKVNVPVPSNEKGEPDLMSDEYYTAAKAKRHGLGLIRFIGELFKLNMLTERIMHECIKKLLINASPEEEEMESLCKLLTTVGQQLDHFKAKVHMDSYFNRMEDMSKNNTLNSRIRFMLMDVIELRNNNWIPRRDNNAPKTIAEIHEDAAKQKEEAEYMRRTASSGGRGLPKMADQMSRAGSGRRDKGSGPHGSGGQTDGWNTVSSSASRKTGDLSKFGSVRNKVSGSVALTPGGGAFGGSKWKTESKDRETLGMARANSTSNTYSVLTHTDTETRKPSDGPFESQKSSSTERKKLQLMPPSKIISDESNAPKSIMTKPSSVSSMSEETAKKKIKNMIEEYFNALDIAEVIYCINDLPKEYHSMAITEFANRVLEKKQEDVYKVTELFKSFITKGLIIKPIFMKGFSSTVEFLVDIGADAPKSYAFTGQLFYSTSIELKEVAELLKPLFEVDDKGIEKVISGYLEAWKKESDEHAIVQKVKDTGFDFKSIFSKKNISDLNKFFDDHGLGLLKK